MKKFKAYWYDLDRVVKEEPDIIEAEDEKEVIHILYLRYTIDQRPAPLLSVNEVKGV